jgi:ankyrin repeat protein
MTERTRLLVEHGADLATPLDNGRMPAEQAALSGYPALVEYLVANGAPAPELEPVDAFLAAVIAGDRETAIALRDATPGLDARARERRPSLVVTAAANRNADAVRLAVELGFDVNALGRSDVPVEQEWETALHSVVGEGDRELVEVLLSLGADPTIEDRRFSSTALGWAEHFGHAELVELLTPLVNRSP